jgi:aldose 1-epimerase
MKTVAVLASMLFAVLSASGQNCCDKVCQKDTSMKVSVQPWGQAPDGQPVELYTLTDGKGVTVRLSTFGANVQSIIVPDRDGKSEDVIFGFDSVEGYVADATFQGAAIGRYGNRIGGAKFAIDGTAYHVTENGGGNCLHGGKPGFDKAVWKASSFECKGKVGVVMTLTSPDGDQGFPGKLDVKITFTLGHDADLTIAYEAVTDKATTVNLTHHMYYNLSGDAKNDILGDILQIKADRMTPVDSGLIPTGELKNVKGTPFDFQTPTAVGLRINAADDQIKKGGGYDHNFVFASADGSLKAQCELYNPVSGRVMTILTTEPAVQFYSGNFLSGATGKNGAKHDFRHALCLETQHYPDSPNHANFPSTILRPGETYKSTTVLQFSVRK